MTTLFCPGQTDFLTFRTPDGFGAVILDLVEGFLAVPDGHTAVHLTNGIWYESVESVPTLVDRFAGVKKLRYAKDRGDEELVKENTLINVVPTVTTAVAKATPPEGIGTPRPVWKTKPVTSQ